MANSTLDIETEADLSALREAAATREWSALQVVLARLLNPLPFFAALSAVIEGLIAALPLIESSYEEGDPRRSVPRQLLSGMMSYGFAPDQLPDGLVAEYEHPGAAQYVHAVLELCRAAQRDKGHDVRLAFLVSAAANGIIAQMGKLFYNKNPDLFARVRDNHVDPDSGEYTDPDAAKIPILLWMDEEVAALDSALWSALADRIEAAYKAL